SPAANATKMPRSPRACARRCTACRPSAPPPSAPSPPTPSASAATPAASPSPAPSSWRRERARRRLLPAEQDGDVADEIVLEAGHAAAEALRELAENVHRRQIATLPVLHDLQVWREPLPQRPVLLDRPAVHVVEVDQPQAVLGRKLVHQLP